MRVTSANQEGNRGLATQVAVTRERARQLEHRLEARIRQYLPTELGDDFELPVAGRGRPETIVRTAAHPSALSAVSS